MQGQVEIAGESRSLEDAEPEWINQRIQRMRADRLAVWVRVTINDGAINIVLQAPGCPSRSGASRRASADERELFDLWDEHHLNDAHFSGGDVVALLRQLPR